jgi:hypothetical protein
MTWTDDEKLNIPRQYNCQLLYHNVTEDQIKNPELPSDAYVVQVVGEEESFYDLCRSSKMSNVFDLYYDKFGNNIRKIDFAYGRQNPRLWGYEAPQQKRARK